MGSVGFSLKLSACILIFLILENFCVTCEEEWCYDKPSCGPATWGSLGSCNGKRQSPINIDTKTVKSDLGFGHIYFNHYEDRNIAKTITNTGYTCQINFQPKASIYSPSFQGIYFIQQLHLHWGTENSNGSEHTINGKRYGMEMHLVHTKNNMSIEDASKEPDGLVVLAFFIQGSEGSEHVTTWDPLAKLLKKIPEKGDSWDVKGKVSPGGLLKDADLSRYFRYGGSLTTPLCAEAVTWIIFEEPLTVPCTVLRSFTNSLFFTTMDEGRPMQNNFRPTQDLNDRSVYYYREDKSMSTCMKYCIAKLF